MMIRMLHLLVLAILLVRTTVVTAEPIEFSYTDANGIRFAALEEGTGALVLLLHGYPETARSWSAVQHRIANAGYRVVAPNMRGYAPSGVPKDGDYRVGTLGADVLALIRALGATSAVVVGHDWGASAAYAAATAQPDAVRGLVAIAIPHPLGIADDPSVLLKASHFLYYQLPGIRWWVSRNDFSHIDSIYQSWSPTLDPDSHDLTDIKRTLASSGGVDAALGYYWSFGENEAPGRIVATADTLIEVPSLVIAGEADGAIDIKHFSTARPAFASAYEFVSLAQTGHFPQIEAPDKTADAIIAFLSRLPPPE